VRVFPLPRDPRYRGTAQPPRACQCGCMHSCTCKIFKRVIRSAHPSSFLGSFRWGDFSLFHSVPLWVHRDLRVVQFDLSVTCVDGVATVFERLAYRSAGKASYDCILTQMSIYESIAKEIRWVTHLFHLVYLFLLVRVSYKCSCRCAADQSFEFKTSCWICRLKKKNPHQNQTNSINPLRSCFEMGVNRELSVPF